MGRYWPVNAVSMRPAPKSSLFSTLVAVRLVLHLFSIRSRCELLGARCTLEAYLENRCCYFTDGLEGPTASAVIVNRCELAIPLFLSLAMLHSFRRTEHTELA